VQPAWHPYCEVSFTHFGRKRQHVGLHSLECHEGDVLLLGPGTPHHAENLSEPHRSIAVFFLPRLLLEMGPNGDGARLLAQCCGARNISEQILRPPPDLRARLAELFDAMAREFEDSAEGSELRLRCLLVEILVNLARWKATKVAPGIIDPHAANWMQLQKPLRFVHERYAEPIYVKELAAASGLSVTRLQQLFHDTVGLSCMQYIQCHRLSRAMALLSAPDVRITEVANEVGFETLSHFNASFRRLVGVTPSEYLKRQLKPHAFDGETRTGHAAAAQDQVLGTLRRATG
jgi:AraC-like DNA-binding protein